MGGPLNHRPARPTTHCPLRKGVGIPILWMVLAEWADNTQVLPFTQYEYCDIILAPIHDPGVGKSMVLWDRERCRLPLSLH